MLQVEDGKIFCAIKFNSQIIFCLEGYLWTDKESLLPWANGFGNCEKIEVYRMLN